MRHAYERRPVQFREPQAERRRMDAAERCSVRSPEERLAVAEKKAVLRLVVKARDPRNRFDRFIYLLHVYCDRRHGRGESRGECRQR